jgi:hypothetical protein
LEYKTTDYDGMQAGKNKDADDVVDRCVVHTMMLRLCIIS